MKLIPYYGQLNKVEKKVKPKKTKNRQKSIFAFANILSEKPKKKF